MLRTINLFFILALCSFNSVQAVTDRTDKLVQIRLVEPGFPQIMEEAIHNEHLGWSEISDLQARLKKAPWVPTVYLGYDHALKEVSSVSVTDNVSVTSSGVMVGPDRSDLDESYNNGQTIRARFVWKLDELVYHPASVQVARYARELGNNRLSLSGYLFKIYSERKKLLSQYHTLSLSRAKKRQLRESIYDLTEKLDYFTKGKFRTQWWKE